MLDIGKLWSNTVGRPKKTEVVAEPGSTIPREIRMGARPLLEAVHPVQTLGTDTRSAERFVPRRTATVLTLTTGKKLSARVINMSSVAVAIEADLSLFDPAQVAAVGSHPVTFGRKIALGSVFVFVKPIAPSRCTVDFVI